MSHVRVGHRLLAGFLAIGALMVGVAAIAVMGLRSLNDDLNRIVDFHHPKTEHLHAIVDETSAIAVAVRNALLADGEAETRNFVDRADEGRARLGELLDQLDRGFGADDRSREVQQALHSEYAAYTVEVVKASRALGAGHRDAARTIVMGSMQARLGSYVEALRKLSDYETGLMAQARADAATSYERGRNSIFAIVLAAALVTAGLAFVLTRSITHPLRRAGAAADAIAHGDLSVRIEIEGHDETALLARSLESMRTNLSAMVRKIKNASDVMNGAAGEIARGNRNLSQRTESHASSLEETAASVEEMTAAVRQNDAGAQRANELAAGAAAVAVKGGGVVSEVVRTMSSIQGGSKKIAEITGVIDSIAFQTNILALNAAVEAARAGDHGRGFAVVAAEVRALAQRSAKAAQEIRGLIAESSVQIRDGSQLADAAGRTMQEIVASVKLVTEIMSQITIATREQRGGIEQVSATLTHMDAMTQQNAAMVEEVSAAATSLEGQARELAGAVSAFRMDNAPHEIGGVRAATEGFFPARAALTSR
jgi:methyl-accepting chemotaxis protein